MLCNLEETKPSITIPPSLKACLLHPYNISLVRFLAPFFNIWKAYEPVLSRIRIVAETFLMMTRT